MSEKVQVHPSAALLEAAALADYYRNRCLLLSNEVVMLKQERSEMLKELELLREIDTSDLAGPETDGN